MSCSLIPHVEEKILRKIERKCSLGWNREGAAAKFFTIHQIVPSSVGCSTGVPGFYQLFSEFGIGLDLDFRVYKATGLLFLSVRGFLAVLVPCSPAGLAASIWLLRSETKCGY